jgi:uncharacterized protein
MGYLAVDSDAGASAGIRRDDYGKLRLLVITSDSTVPGPGQVQNTFNSDPQISSQINLLKQGQSQVLNGNLLTVPVGGGLLYVQPVYVQASSGTQLPQLQRVLVAFGKDVAFESTLNDALNTLFGGNSGANAGDQQVAPDQGSGSTPTPSPGATTSPTPTPTPSQSSGSGSSSPEYQAALQAARQAMLDRDAALKAGDWTAYGQADQRLTDAVNTLIALGG